MLEICDMIDDAECWKSGKHCDLEEMLEMCDIIDDPECTTSSKHCDLQ